MTTTARPMRWAIVAACACCAGAGGHTVLVEAEGFDQAGGWVVDSQFIDEMGSPFLLAHGLGAPVADATTTVNFPATGTYRVWVRTRHWVWMSKAPGTAGRFKLVVGGKELETTFGTAGRRWHWQAGGAVAVANKAVAVSLRDLTGFEGRCDAVVFSDEAGFGPPAEAGKLAAFRRKALGLPDESPTAGQFDLVVVGGGTAGTCAAVAAARLGLTVALIQNRPVLGGNNSSEVRVWRGGGTNFEPYPRIGDIDREFGPRATASPGKAAEFGDDRKLKVVRAEKNISLFLNHHAFKVATKGAAIASVDARNIANGRELRFGGKWFADCTGDGTIGFLAGADHEMTAKGHMGRSNMWRIVDTHKPQPFPRCPWAHDLSGKPIPKGLGAWFWESGFDHDPIADGEHIRDNNFRGMYGAGDALKNARGLYPTHRLEWAAFVAGKRESRRLLGDVVLTKQHVIGGKAWPDGCVPSTWSIDLHLPDPRYAKGFEGDEFLSAAQYTGFTKPYWVPYRCLYSRNVSNLFMAGRCVSVTHEALGTVRVMRTTGMMGEIVGLAAAVCKSYATTPRGVYTDHLAALQDRMTKGVGKLPPVVNRPPPARGAPAKLAPPKWLKTAGPNLARDAKVTVSSTYQAGKYPPSGLNDGKIDLADNAGRWLSDPKPPHHVELAWDAPRTIAAARVVSGYNNGGRVADPIRNFALEAHDGTGWKLIPGTQKVAANTRVNWHATFAPVRTGRVRLTVTATPINIARIWEIELYGPPATTAPAGTTKSETAKSEGKP